MLNKVMKPSTKRPLWLVVGLSALALCLLLASVPALVWFTKGRGVTAAVDASFPELCNDWRDKMVTRPSLTGWFTNYDVVCVFGYTTNQVTVMTVNVLTCEVHPALTWPRDWRHLRTMLFGGGQKMPVCP